jgi:inosine-uridine nucleoside N-ribohydrolase
MRDGRRLTVVMIGAATDVASALLADPGLADRVEVVAMGFDGWPRGGDPWNVKNDVRAWQAVLDSPVSLVVGDGAAGKEYLKMSGDLARRSLGDSGDRGRLLVSVLRDWLKDHADLALRETGDRGSWPIWDEVTVAHLLGLARSETLPRPSLRDDLTFDHPRDSGRTLKWVRSVDTAAVWSDLAEVLRDRP